MRTSGAPSGWSGVKAALTRSSAAVIRSLASTVRLRGVPWGSRIRASTTSLSRSGKARNFSSPPAIAESETRKIMTTRPAVK